MLRKLSLALAMTAALSLPSVATAHGWYGGGWHGPGWRGDHWGYGGGWRGDRWGYGGGWRRPYGYYGSYGGGCWRWLDGQRVWVC